MPAFTRTIVVLDQASGAPRVDDERVVGLDLHPAAARWIEQQAAQRRETVLLLPPGAGRAPPTGQAWSPRKPTSCNGWRGPSGLPGSRRSARPIPPA